MRTAAAGLLATLLTLLLLEGGSRLAARAGWLPVTLPPASEYWWSEHPELGMWRHPDASWEHRTPCFAVTYETNSVGARDVDRPRTADEPRVVVLGDSFVAGWGVPLDARFSNRLEVATGVPHLNFAMEHFSPYQSLLAYRTLAAGYQHDAIVLGLLPANDFLDAEVALAATIPESYLYRPYLVGESPDYHRLDLREHPVRAFLRRHSLGFNGVLRAQENWRARRIEADGPILRAKDGEIASWFYDFRESHATRLEAVLRMLADEADGRPVAVVLIPVIFDLQRYASAGPAPLADRLRAGLGDTSLRIIDLLPAMAESGTPPADFFLSCDYHWSVAGNAVAARLTQRALTGIVYPPSSAATTPSR
jgi:hypothetical protein